MNKISEKQLWGAEKGFKKWEAMIGAMTEEEREDPDLLASSQTRQDMLMSGCISNCGGAD